MKKTHWAGVAFFILLISAWFVYHKFRQPGTLDKSERDFSVPDTFSITKIRLSDKHLHSSELIRTDSGWIVNGKYPVRSDAYLNLMEAIKRVEVFYPVPQSQKESVLRAFSHQAIKVEIFKGNTCIKKYYLGGETQDGQGTFMLLSYPDEENKNYETPFVTGIPGFIGFLTPRYITREEWWRSTEIIHAPPDKIQQISMFNHENPDSSFTIIQEKNNNFSVYSKQNILQPIPFKLKQYIAYFYSLHTELYFSKQDKILADSLLRKGKPFRSLLLVLKNGKKEQFLFYRRPVEPSKDEEFKAKYPFDPERFFLFKKEKGTWEDFSYAQYYVFGKIFINFDYFLKN